jgi:tetratricopeptide (TPR) repeat protein
MRYFAGSALVLAVVVFAAYAPVLENGFVYFDDNVYITENIRVRQGLTWDNAAWAFTAFDAANWHPLTWLSHLLDVTLFGLNPAGHHAVSLLLHVLAALLLFGALRCATGRLWPPALAAALFALHPLHVESVAWASERTDVLSAVFWFAALWAYVCYARRPGLLRYAQVALFFALGLMAKPMLVTLPLVLLLLDFWPLGRRSEPNNTVPFLLAEKIPLFALSLASAVITIIAQQQAIAGFGRIDAGARLTNAAVSYGTYLWQTIWPAGLSVYYPHPHEPRIAGAIVAALVCAAATASCAVFSRQKRYLLTGWLWYLVTLLPVIGIIQAGDQAHADRFTYLPLTGIFLMAAWGAGDLAAARPALKKPLALAAAALLVCMGVMTHRTASFWKDDLTLFGRAVAVVPGNYPMKVKLGDALFSQGKNDEAMREFRESLAIRPSGYAYAGIGAVFQKKGVADSALACYRKALALNPGITSALLNAGKMLMRRGAFDEAEKLLRKAVAREPALAEARQELGNILALQGKYAAAADEYRHSLRSGRNSITLLNLGACLAALGRQEEAAAFYEESLALGPRNAEARYGYAIVLADLGRKTEALDQLRQAMDLDPENGEIRKFYATLTADKR